MSELDRIGREACVIARRAGAAILEVYAGTFSVEHKADNSPLTAADMAAHHTILEGLRALAPDIPVLSEESADIPWSTRSTWTRYWLVDPLDGTREFVKRNGEFTVNIALIERSAPAAGIVLAPALGRIFCGETGSGAFEAGVEAETDAASLAWRALQARKASVQGPVVVASRSHRDERTEAYLKCLKVKKIVSAGSSLKFCLLAAGEADLYPRFGRTMEWDTAAGHAVLAAAGGSVGLETGEPLTYGKASRGYDNPAFIARGA